MKRNERMVRVLGAFLDTLVLNVYPTDLTFQPIKARVAPELQEELKLLKEQAQEQEEAIPTRFAFPPELPLMMTQKGSDGFQWILKNTKLTVAVNRSSKAQLLAQVRCSSEYLWSVRDLGKILSDVHLFLVSIFGEYILLQVSSCDMAVDLVNLSFGTAQEIKEQFLTRAQLDDERPAEVEEAYIDGPESIKRRWRRITGLPFGARKAALSAIIYDKTFEIKHKSREKTWFYDLWRAEASKQGFVWTEEMAVWRVEVRYRREALNEMKLEGEFHGISDAFELGERLPGLWAYAVGHVGGGSDGLPDGWLRYVVPTNDTNRSRWPVHPDWEVIQGAYTRFQPEQLEESEYEREEREKEEMLQLVDAELEARPWKESYTRKRRRKSAPVVPPEPKVKIPESLAFDLRPFIRKRKYQENMRRLVAQIAGCTITAEAWRRSACRAGVSVDLSDTFHFLFEAVQDYMEENRIDFDKRVSKKRVLYSMESAINKEVSYAAY